MNDQLLKGVFRYTIEKAPRYTISLITAKSNIEGSYHYDPEVPIENGTTYEIENKLQGKTVYLDFPNEVIYYIEELNKINS